MTGVLLDEMYPPSLAQKLRADGHDVLAVLDLEVGLASRSDADVLAWATRHQRCVVTENIRDFARLASVTPHAGIVFVSPRRFPRTATGMAKLSTALGQLIVDTGLPAPGTVHWIDAAGPRAHHP